MDDMLPLAVPGWVRRAAHVSLVFGALACGDASFTKLSAANVTLAWDASTDPTVVGYNVYSGTASRTYANTVQAQNSTSITLSNLAPGTTYYFAATTYNVAGLESDYSAEASYTVPVTSGIQPPTLDPIVGVVIGENSGPQVVGLTGIGAGSTNITQNLFVSAFSGNLGLIPNPVVSYTSPSSTAALTFTAAPNSYGSAVITVMVDNGGTSSNTIIRTFTINVVPVNNPPTLDPLPNLVLDENSGSQTLNLTGISSGDPTTGQTVSLSAISSNPKLLANPSVTYTSPATTGLLTFTPSPHVSGSALLTVSANDGQPTNSVTSISFLVTVNPAATTPFSNSIPPTAWTMYWQQNSGQLAQWSMSGTNRVSGTSLQPSNVGTTWKVVGAAEADANGQTELFFEHTGGTLVSWSMSGSNRSQDGYLSPSQVPPEWRVRATGDLNGDGQKTLLFENTSGDVAAWFMNGTNSTLQSSLNPPRVNPAWRIAGLADLNGDGQRQVLLQHTNGWVGIWYMSGTNAMSFSFLNPPRVDPNWHIVGTHDFNGDGRTDVLLQHRNGWIGAWLMNGTNAASFHFLNPPRVDPTWKVVGPR